MAGAVTGENILSGPEPLPAESQRAMQYALKIRVALLVTLYGASQRRMGYG
jgi:hypothetical protein